MMVALYTSFKSPQTEIVCIAHTVRDDRLTQDPLGSHSFGQDTGTILFDYPAPKSSDGRQMVLHYMVIKG
jgi:hypothetical protein